MLKRQEFNIHGNHRYRMRVRYAKEGLDNYEDHEILELLLHYPIRNGNTNETAHRLINTLGGFSKVFDADINDIAAVKGVGRSSAIFIKLVRELFDYYVNEKKKKATLFSSMTEVAEYCAERYKDVVDEMYSVMLFDVSGRLLGFERLYDCSFNDPDGIKKKVGYHLFTYNACSFILVRNALDEDVAPSQKETWAFREIMDFFKVFNRTMLEYLIITQDTYMPLCKYYYERNNLF